MPDLQPAPAQPTPFPKPALCPYCGEASQDSARCSACRGLFEPLSRQASQNSMGPWFVRDPAHPFLPGCSFQTLCAMVRRGTVTPASVIRGPTTRQFWTTADRAPSVANLLGRCHACTASVGPEVRSCPTCGASFEPESDRQFLGLAPVRLLPGQAPPEEIAAASAHSGEHHSAAKHEPAPTPAGATARPAFEPAPRRGWLVAGWVIAAVSTFALAGLLTAILSGLDLPFLAGPR